MEDVGNNVETGLHWGLRGINDCSISPIICDLWLWGGWRKEKGFDCMTWLQINDKVGNFLIQYLVVSAWALAACSRFFNDDNGQLKDNGSKKGGMKKTNISCIVDLITSINNLIYFWAVTCTITKMKPAKVCQKEYSID